MQKTILVTGGAGYIGSACVSALLKDGHQVMVFDDFSTGQKDKVPKEAEIIEGNILDVETLDKVCQSQNFDAVMHFAAKKAVGESEVNPTLYFKNNVTGSLNILEMMDKYQIPQIIFSSTAAVYNPPTNDELVTESSPLSPVSVYGLSKLMIEDMIKAYARTGKIKQFAILRYFNVAGDAGLNFKEDNPQNVFPILAQKIQNSEPFSVFGNDYDTKDGTCVRDYIHLRDLVSGHLLALASNKSGEVYNLGNGVGYSVNELVDNFRRISERVVEAKISSKRKGDPAIIIADSTKAKQELNWQPTHTLEDMVEDTLRVYG